jgi:flagellar motor switch protein FliG
LVSYLNANQAAHILAALNVELQAEVCLRIATMDRTSPDILESLEGVLKTKLSSLMTQEFSAAGGVEYLVKVLNNVDRATERRILEFLDEADAQLAADVRKLMFTFDDIILLDDRSLQRLLREIDSRDLTLALKGASEELRSKVFKNQSTRAAQMLKEELEVMGPVRVRNIEEAQQRIANIVRRLDEAEEIVIAGKGDDAFI